MNYFYEKYNKVIGRTTVYRYSNGNDQNKKTTNSISKEQVILFLYLKKKYEQIEISDKIDILVNNKIAIQLDPEYTHKDRYLSDVKNTNKILDQGYNLIRLREGSLFEIPNCKNMKYLGSNYGKYPKDYCKDLAERLFDVISKQTVSLEILTPEEMVDGLSKYLPDKNKEIQVCKDEFRYLINQGLSPSQIRKNHPNLIQRLQRHVGSYKYEKILNFTGVEKVVTYRVVDNT